MSRLQTDHCVEIGCFLPCWAKDRCRPHYRKFIGEGSRRWERVKGSPDLLTKAKAAKKAWDASDRGKERKRIADLKYMEKNRDTILAYKRAWGEAERFGGLREKVLKRDGYRCVLSGDTKDLVVHHIDDTGRGTDEHNNDISNLITLCRSCHMKHHFSKIHEARMKKLDVV